MAPNTPFPSTSEYSLNASNTSTQITDTHHYELQDVLAQLYEQDSQDNVQMQELTSQASVIASLASEFSYFDFSSCGIVDSLTLVNCKHLISGLLNEGDLAGGNQEENIGASSASTESITHRDKAIDAADYDGCPLKTPKTTSALPSCLLRWSERG